jgi:hypothetical protein
MCGMAGDVRPVTGSKQRVLIRPRIIAYFWLIGKLNFWAALRTRSRREAEWPKPFASFPAPKVASAL